MFSSLSRTTERTDRTARPRRRSESVSALKRVKDSSRIPAVRIDDESDVATLVCKEIGRAMMMDSTMNMGVFLKSASNARRDIGMSDATVLISVAVLNHVGNTNMAEKLLSKSATLSKYYERMGLKDAVVREMLVTMLFALNPLFVEMLEKCVKMAMDRSTASRRGPDRSEEMSNALSLLTLEGAITTDEYVKALEDTPASAVSLEPEARRFSLQRTPIDMIAPSDSASVVEAKPKKRYRINEEDLRAYGRRRNSGNEIEFDQVFFSAKKPVMVETRNPRDRTGLGYSRAPRTKNDEDHIAAMNRILGSQSIASANLETGEVTRRRPRVMDFIESEAISQSVLISAPDLASNVETTVNTSSAKAPVPTDFGLPRSTFDYDARTNKRVARVDSFEELVRSEGLI